VRRAVLVLTPFVERPAGKADRRERRNASARERSGSISKDRALCAGMAAGDALAE
jgi:hypothetical protein